MRAWCNDSLAGGLGGKHLTIGDNNAIHSEDSGDDHVGIDVVDANHFFANEY